MKMSVIIRIIVFGAIVAAGYWYWSGPWQDKVNPSYEAMLEENQEKMDMCMRAAAFELGATGTGTAARLAREQCAEKYNLYEADGRWHRHDIPRPD
jgi:hypothetical protein